MTTSTEALKDWISDGYNQGATYLFIVKGYKALEPHPYFVRPHEDVGVVRASILDGGEEIIEELNMEVKVLLLHTVK